LLPVPYYLVTVTVPEALRRVVRANQRACYQAIFDAGSQTIRQLASGPRFIGTDRLGFFAALHTWGRDPMVYHPHVHFVVPGGGVSADGRATLKYLAPYVYRAAISNNRIESVDETSVTYWITPTDSERSITRRVSGNQFVRGFLQHTLPSHFPRLRYYGFASHNSKLSPGWVRMLVWFSLGWCYVLARQAVAEPIPRRPVRCPQCGGEMQLVAITDGCGRFLYNHPLPYLDSS
jgi:hypothetical protein